MSKYTVPWIKLVSQGKKEVYRLHEEKNQQATSFTYKNQHATSSRNKNQHTTSSINKIKLTKRKINVQVLQRKTINIREVKKKKLSRNRFHERQYTSDKFHEQNQFFEERKLMYKFQEEKIQRATCFMNKNQHAVKLRVIAKCVLWICPQVAKHTVPLWAKMWTYLQFLKLTICESEALLIAATYLY